MSEPAPGTPLRPLGPVEASFVALDPTTLATALRFSGPADESAFRRALDELQESDELLRVGIDVATGRFVAGRAGPIPLRVLPREGADAGRRALEEELAQPFDLATGPLARATLLRGDEESELVLAFHHAIADYESVRTRTFDLLDGMSPGRASGERAARPRHALAPPLDRLAPAHLLGIRGALRALLGLLATILVVLFRRPERLACEATAEAADRRTRVAFGGLSADETRRLVARAAAEGSSVHATVAAAAIEAVGERIGRGERPRLACLHSEPARCRLALDPRPRGSYSPSLLLFHRADRELWALARDVETQLARSVASGAMHAGARLGFPLGLTPAKRDRMVDLMMPLALCVSSHAASIPLAIGPFQLRDVRGGLALTGAGGSRHYPLFAAHFFDGALRLDVSFVEPLLSRASAEALLARTLELLRAGIATG